MNLSKPILIIHQGALGDLIMSLPALYSMRLFYGQIPWTVTGNPETLSLLHHRFYAREVVSIHHQDWAWLFQEKAPVPNRFRRFLASFQKAYLFSKSKPETLIRGLTRAGLGKVLWIPSFPDVQQNRSLQGLQKEILESENIPWVESEKTIFPAPEDLQSGLEYMRRTLNSKEALPLWAIHPGSGSPHKNWPLEGFLEVAGELLNGKKVQPLFLLGPVEEEASSGMVKTIEGQGFPILRSATPLVLAGVLSQCAGYLGNDSGVSHLAAALGLPTVVLFGPTDPLFWGPKGKKVKILSHPILCAPCTPEARRVCPHKECLTSLTAQQVLESIGS